MRRAPLLLVLAGALGCTPAGGKPTAPAVTSKPKPPLTTPKPGLGTPIISDNGGGVVSNNGATFVGKVRAPAGIISDNGGGVVSNNGAGFVGKVRRQLLAVDQVPVAGATVRVRDAAGKPVAGPDGKDLVTVTDAQGGYGFAGLKPSQNLLVVAELPAGKGQVQAVALRGAEGAVDLDVVSTLTTGYVVGTYVTTQADPVTTFERLTPEAERATRVAAGAALTAGDVAGLTALTPLAVTTTVEALRARDQAFDAQLEVVRKLLLVVGQADLGAGRDATTVALGDVRAVLPLPDGTLAIACLRDDRVWQVDARGVLRVLVGSGRSEETGGDGQPAAALALNGPRALGLDGRGRLALADLNRLARLEPDGSVAVGALAQGVFARAILPGRTEGELLVVDADGLLHPHAGATLAASAHLAGALVPPGAAAADEEDEDLPWQRYEAQVGRTPAGLLHVLRFVPQPDDPEETRPPTPLAYVSDLASGQRTAAPAVEGARIAVGPDDTWFSMAADGALVATPPAGAPVRYPAAQLAQLPAALRAGLASVGGNPPDAALVAAPGGKVLIHDASLVWELAPGGTARHVAGVVEATQGGANALDFDLSGPDGVAVGPDGSIYVNDFRTSGIVRRDPAGKVTRFCGATDADAWERDEADDDVVVRPDGTRVALGAGYAAPAAQAYFGTPGGLRADGDGLLLIDDARWIRRVAADGAVSTLFTAPAGRSIIDVLPAREGGWWLLRGGERGDPKRLDLVRRLADGSEQVLTTFPSAYGNLAYAPDGTLWVRQGASLGRWTGGAFQAVASDPRIDVDPGYEPQPTRLVVDAAGTACFATGALVLRWDAARGWTILAGPGGRFWSGAGAADGLSEPTALCLDREGGLLIVDADYETVRRLEPAQLK